MWELNKAVETVGVQELLLDIFSTKWADVLTEDLLVEKYGFQLRLH